MTLRQVMVSPHTRARHGGLFLLFALLALPLVAAENQVVIRADVAQTPPAWARLERKLIQTMNRAGEEFVRVYARPDGTLYWKERYEGGMNSSDDAYEEFRGFSLHHALGGSRKLDELHRRVWEGITRQFTRYGQIYREFDSNWDWMHHGEGYVSFYPLGLADPNDERFRERSIRFAGDVPRRRPGGGQLRPGKEDHAGFDERQPRAQDGMDQARLDPHQREPGLLPPSLRRHPRRRVLDGLDQRQPARRSVRPHRQDDERPNGEGRHCDQHDGDAADCERLSLQR